MLLKEIATVKGGKRLPKSDSLVSEKTDHPYIRIRDMYQSYPLELNDDFEYITSETYEKIKKYTVEQGDVIIAVVGNTIGLVSVIGESLHGANLTENCNKIVDIHNYEGRFLYYFLTSAIGQNEIKKGIVGSSQPKLPIYNIEKIQLPDFPLEEQARIVEVLETIDKKISNNEKINENLADQAQAIYQQYFLIEADPNWPLGHLSDLIDVKYGKDHKKLADGVYPVYGSGGIMRYVERPLYEKESVLIPRKGTLNNVMYVNQPFWSVDTMFYTEMKQANVAKFVYHFVKSKDLASMNSGSAVPSMTTAILNALELRIPSAEALLQFENSVAPMYEMMKKNEDQSRKLTELRDALLPKLMSGEIDISSLNI